MTQDNSSFEISGKKIFIACGEHNMAEYPVHVVHAPLPCAPPGTCGISLSLVSEVRSQARLIHGHLKQELPDH